MLKDKRILWITQTAMFTALLIVMQAVTSMFGNTIVTGSIVNLILIISVMICGFSSGLTVAVISPVFAALFGIAPLWQIVPVIMEGNAVLVTVWWLIGNKIIVNRLVSRIIALVTAAVCKFLVLYFGVVQIAMPLFLPNLSEQKAAALSVSLPATFSFPQIITASIGGMVAILILPVLRKAVKEK